MEKEIIAEDVYQKIKEIMHKDHDCFNEKELKELLNIYKKLS